MAFQPLPVSSLQTPNWSFNSLDKDLKSHLIHDHAQQYPVSAKDRALNVPEILQTIFEQMPHNTKTLARCMQVKKVWTTEAARVLYRTLDDGIEGDEELQRLNIMRGPKLKDITNMNTTPERRAAYMRLVREVGYDHHSLDIEEMDESDDTQIQSEGLYFPFVRTATIYSDYFGDDDFDDDEPMVEEVKPGTKLPEAYINSNLHELRVVGGIVEESLSQELKVRTPSLRALEIKASIRNSTIAPLLKALPKLERFDITNAFELPDDQGHGSLKALAKHKNLKMIRGVGIRLDDVEELVGQPGDKFESVTQASFFHQPDSGFAEFALDYPRALQRCVTMMPSLVHLEIGSARLEVLKVVSEMAGIRSLVILEYDWDVKSGEFSLLESEPVSGCDVLKILSKMPSLEKLELQRFSLSHEEEPWTVMPTQGVLLAGIPYGNPRIPWKEMKKFIDEKPGLLEVSIANQPLPGFSSFDLYEGPDYDYARLTWTRATDIWKVSDWQYAARRFKQSVGRRGCRWEHGYLGPNPELPPRPIPDYDDRDSSDSEGFYGGKIHNRILQRDSETWPPGLDLFDEASSSEMEE